MQQAAGVTAVGSIAGRSRGEGHKVGARGEGGVERGEKTIVAT